MVNITKTLWGRIFLSSQNYFTRHYTGTGLYKETFYLPANATIDTPIIGKMRYLLGQTGNEYWDLKITTGNLGQYIESYQYNNQTTKERYSLLFHNGHNIYLSVKTIDIRLLDVLESKTDRHIVNAGNYT